MPYRAGRLRSHPGTPRHRWAPRPRATLFRIPPFTGRSASHGLRRKRWWQKLPLARGLACWPLEGLGGKGRLLIEKRSRKTPSGNRHLPCIAAPRFPSAFAISSSSLWRAIPAFHLVAAACVRYKGANLYLPAGRDSPCLAASFLCRGDVVWHSTPHNPPAVYWCYHHQVFD